MPRAKLVPVLAALAVMVGCASTPGTAPTAATETPTVPTAPSASLPSTSVATITAQTPQAAGQSQPGIKFLSEPAGAHVYLNNLYIGDTPLFYSSFLPGTVKLLLQKEGYYPSDRLLDLDPTSYTTVDVQLDPITGFLALDVSPHVPDGDITVDDQPANAGTNEVAVGHHSLRVQTFGYDDYVAAFDVAEHATTTLSVTLKPAAFRLSELAVSRPVLNPFNPGTIGKTVISFQVSTEGGGALQVLDGAGALRFTADLPPFTRRAQSLLWNGRDVAGQPLPDGTYTVTIVAHDAGGAEQRLSSSIEISRAALVSYRSLWSGLSGLLFVGSPEVLPPASYQIDFVTLGNFQATGQLVPAELAGRFMVAPDIELDVQGGIELGLPASSPYTLGAAAKFGLVEAGLNGPSAAITVKGTYLAGTSADLSTNFTGLSVGSPVEYRIGQFGVILMPELVVSPFQVAFGNLTPYGGADANASTLGFTAWGYGRAGLFFDTGSVMVGVSASARTLPFAEGFGLDTVPLAGGVELHWLIPQSNLVLSALATVNDDPNSASTYPLIGAGIGWLF